jgi:hypothetical protein
MSKATRNRARRAQAAARREPDSRRRTRTLYAAVAVVAAAVAGALVLASVLTARDDDSAPSGATVAGAAESRALFAGLTAVGRAVPGLDVERAFAEQSGTRVDAELEAAEAAVTENGIRGTPSFAVGRTGGTLRVVELDSLDAQALRPDLDALLAG